MRKWVLVLLLSSFGQLCWSQNLRFDNIAIGPRGPVPFATVAVCSQPANTSTAPCSPLASLCSSLSDAVCTSPNPVTADLLGNYHFYVKTTLQPATVQIYGPQISTPYVMPDQFVPYPITTATLASTTAIIVQNAGVTGTTINTLTKLTGAPSTAVKTATTDTGGIQGICIANCSTSGSATIQTTGLVSCVFDGATTAGDYIQNSVTVAGDCHDTGSGVILSGSQVNGRVLSTNGGAGTYQVNLFPPEINNTLGGIPTLAVGSAAGTGALITAFPAVFDRAGELRLTTGSGTTSSGTLFTVTFSTSFPNSAFCTVSMGNNAVLINASTGNLSLTVSAAGTALGTSSGFNFYYLCNGY